MKRLENYSWLQVKESLKTRPVGLIPVGAVENHGPHLPLGTDWFSAQAVAEEAALQENLLILPGSPVGISGHHRHFWGTLWLPAETLRDYLLGIARSAASHGLNRLVFVNGHGGNTAVLDQTLRILRKEGIYIYLFEWWRAIPELISQLCELPEDHAGDMETSIILALYPELVAKDKIKDAAAGVIHWGKLIHGVQVALETKDFTPTGVLGNPALATAEKGQALLKAGGRELALFCRWFSEQPEDSLMPTPKESL